MKYLNKNFWLTFVGFLLTISIAIFGLYLASVYFPDNAEPSGLDNLAGQNNGVPIQ